MSKIAKKIEIPLDEDGYLRRECNLCKSQFKIHVKTEYLENQTKELLDSFLKDTNNSEENENDKQEEYYCPYCGQKNLSNELWTTEQIKYIHIFAQNYINNLINKDLLKKLKNFKSSGSFFKIEFKGKELPFTEPWISPEENDLNVFPLSCCNEKIKIEIKHNMKKYFCFYCGFEHKIVERQYDKQN